MFKTRFLAKIDKQENGCWEWTASCSCDGYGHSWYEGKSILAHRFSYMIHHPLTIDLREYPKICVCHRCDNPKCVNPAHLFLGTHTDNMIDKENKKRANRNNPAKGEKVKSSKLTEQKVREIRENTQKEAQLKIN